MCFQSLKSVDANCHEHARDANREGSRFSLRAVLDLSAGLHGALQHLNGVPHGVFATVAVAWRHTQRGALGGAGTFSLVDAQGRCASISAGCQNGTATHEFRGQDRLVEIDDKGIATSLTCDEALVFGGLVFVIAVSCAFIHLCAYFVAARRQQLAVFLAGRRGRPVVLLCQEEE